MHTKVLTKYSDHCIKQCGDCPHRAAAAHLLYSDDPIYESVSFNDAWLFDDYKSHNVCSDDVLQWRTDLSVDTLYHGDSSVLGTRVESVHSGTSQLPSWDIEEFITLDLSTSHSYEPDVSLSSSINQSADEAMAENSRSRSCTIFISPTTTPAAIESATYAFGSECVSGFHQRSTSVSTPSSSEPWPVHSASPSSSCHSSEKVPTGRREISSTYAEYRCPTCGKVLAGERLYQKHKRCGKCRDPTLVPQCGACRQTFTLPKDLERHQTWSCSTLLQGRGQPKRFVCVQCDRSYPRKDSLLRHVRINHPNAQPIASA